MNLHPQLEKDCIVLGNFSLCQLLLMNDATYPWFILVPQRDNFSEIHQLNEQDQVQLMRESSHLSRVLSEVFNADKMNIAALGNIVPQLHIHHIVRYRDDAAWPAPVWGKSAPHPYTSVAVSTIIDKLSPCLGEGFVFTRTSEPGV